MTEGPHTHDRRERVKALLELVLALPPPERSGALRAAAPDDPELHREVLELARASDRAESEFLAPLIARPQESSLLASLDSDQIGPYRIVRLLGRGAMGAVFEAFQQTPIARRVAVKVLSSLMDPAIVARRFEFERDALARLEHPGIAKILDAGVTAKGHPYLVMELVDGLPLNEFCASRRLALLDRLRLVVSIAQAVHHAHARGIIHRDLKPQNILVTEGAAGPAAKIIDFGVAKLLADPVPGRPSSPGTLVGQVFGTPGYMAPEQRSQGAGDVDARADVFALGVVLYELLTGSLPPESDARIPPSLRSAAAGEFSVDGVLRGSAAELDCIVLKSIEHDRELRYASAQHLADDLHRLMNGLPIAARPPSTLYLVRKFATRHRVSVLLAGTALLMLVAATAATSVGLIRADRDRAIIAAQHAHTESARREADTLNNVLVSILSSVDPARDGPQIPLRTVLDRAGDDALAAAKDSPIASARLRLTLARSYESLGQFPRALGLLAPPLDSPTGLTNELVIDLLLARARNEIGMSRPQAALDAIDQAQSFSEAKELDDRSWALDVNRANAFQLLGRRQEARSIYDTLLARADAAPGTISAVDRARVLINSGVLMHQMDQRDEGEARVLAGRDAVIAALGPDHPLAITAEHNYAILRMARGDTAGAIEKFDAVISMWSRVAGPDHASTLNAQLQLADLYRRAKRFDDAAAILRDLPARLDASLGPDHILAVGAVQSEAELAAARSDWPQAIERMRECVRRYESRRGDADPATWYARAMLLDYQRRGSAHADTSDTVRESIDWRGQLDRLLTDAESRFGADDRYVKAVRRLRDATPATATPP